MTMLRCKEQECYKCRAEYIGSNFSGDFSGHAEITYCGDDVEAFEMSQDDPHFSVWICE